MSAGWASFRAAGHASRTSHGRDGVRRMSTIRGSTVVVTGGASGIGRLIAREFLSRGANVVVWDIHQEAIDAMIEAEGPDRVSGYLCDVSDREHVYQVAEQVIADHQRVDILVNNAGIVSGKNFLDLPDRKIEATFDVNTLALFWTAKAFLPAMLERNRGHIVNIASASGYLGVAKLADYSASKWAVVGFDESLRVELRKRAPGVKTTVVCPYYINTGMFDGVKTRFSWLLPILKPEDVARRTVQGVERDRARVVMPRFVSLVPLMRLLPVPVMDRLADFLGVNTSMDDFIGRDSGRTSGS